MIFCYHVNRFVTVSLLSEIFIQLNPNFQGENCSKNAIFGPNFPPDAQCRFLLEVKQMPQWVVSSEVLTTHKARRKDFFFHFQFRSILSDIRWSGVANIVFKFLLGIIMVSETVQNSQISHSFTFNNYFVNQHVHNFTFSEKFLSYEYTHSHSQHIFIYIQGHNLYSTLGFFIQHFVDVQNSQICIFLHIERTLNVAQFLHMNLIYSLFLS